MQIIIDLQCSTIADFVLGTIYIIYLYIENNIVEFRLIECVIYREFVQIFPNTCYVTIRADKPTGIPCYILYTCTYFYAHMCVCKQVCRD